MNIRRLTSHFTSNGLTALAIGISFLSLLLVSVLSHTPVTVHNTVLDLRDFTQSEKNFTIIHGKTELYWEKFVNDKTLRESPAIRPDALLRIPGVWNNTVVGSEKISGIGYGTIRIKVLCPPQATIYFLKLKTIQTAYRLFIDSTEIAALGTAGTSKETTIPGIMPQVIPLPLVKDSFNLYLQISNFMDNKGGPWQPILIGSPCAILKENNYAFSYNIFFAALLFFIGLHYLLEYHLMRTRPSGCPILASLISFIFILALRIIISGEKVAYQAFPNISPQIFLHIEYITFYLAIVFYQRYINYFFSRNSKDLFARITTIFTWIGGTFAFLSLFCSIYTLSLTVLPYQILIGFALLSQIIFILQRAHFSDLRFMAILSGTLIVLFTAIHDILVDCALLPFGEIIPLGSFFIVMIQEILLVTEKGRMFRERNAFAKRQHSLNSVYRKFLPLNYFKLLKKTPLTIQVGDHVTQKSSVMFCDIRDFTTITESISSNAAYDYINHFLAIAVPVITKNSGFIDKYIGDGVMAIFPHSSDDALNSAIEITKAVKKSPFIYGHREIPIKVGLGIHYGNMTLGVVGHLDRMENTVIGNIVNTAARIENLNKRFKTTIIVSDDALNAASKQLLEKYHTRCLGSVLIMGKKEEVFIHAIFTEKQLNHQ